MSWVRPRTSSIEHREVITRVNHQILIVDSAQVSFFAKLWTEPWTVLVSDNYCYTGRDLKTLVVRRFFNCVAKNLVREMTNSANQHTELPSKKRKITKLQSVADH